MPYRRRTYRRRRRRRYGPSRRSMYHIAQSVIARNLETHYLDTSFPTSGSSTATSNWQWVHLSAVPLGDTAVSRTGDEIQPDGLRIDALYAKNASATDSMAGKVRLVLFQFNEEIDTTTETPAYTALFAENGYLALYKHNMTEVRVISDMKAELTYYNGTVELKKTFPLYKFKKYGYVNKIVYKSTDTNGTKVLNGSLWLAYCSDQTTSTQQPYITLRARLTWKE